MTREWKIPGSSCVPSERSLRSAGKYRERPWSWGSRVQHLSRKRPFFSGRGHGNSRGGGRGFSGAGRADGTGGGLSNFSGLYLPGGEAPAGRKFAGDLDSFPLPPPDLLSL